MKRNFLLIVPVIACVLSFTTINAQWVSASTQSSIYQGKDMGFFQSKTGISLNFDNAYNTDVRRSTDGGQSWTSVNMNNFKNGAFTVLSTVSTTIGYAGGNQLIKTTDAGATWDSVSDISFSRVSRSHVVFNRMVFPTETVGYATITSGSNVIYKTTDGGKNWSAIDTIPYTSNLYAYDADNIYVIANFGITYSNNGGSTWNSVSSTTFGNRTLFSVLFVNSNNGFITGDFGNLFKTTDGGATWSQSTLDTDVNLLGMQFIDANNAIIYGGAEVTFSSSDKGATWKHYFKPDPNAGFIYDLTRAYFFDKGDGAAMYASGIFDGLLYNSHLNSGISTEKENPVALDVYPNPSTGSIMVSTAAMQGTGMMTIYNTAGKVVYRGNIEADSHQSLSLNTYGKGVYTIEIATANAVGHQQVIIE